MKSYHNKSIEQTLIDFNVTTKGLSEKEVIERARTKSDADEKPKKHGFNDYHFIGGGCGINSHWYC